LLNYEKIQLALSGNGFISRVYYFEEIDSTNNFAKSIADDNVLVCTDFQKNGKGRFERIWESEKGKNLTFSIRKSINLKPLANQYVNFFFSYFLFEAIIDLLNENCSKAAAGGLNIKWPNDLLIGNNKIAGLLIESFPLSGRYVIGIGLNVNQTVFKNLENASSLKINTGIEFDRNDILINIIRKFSDNFELLNSGKYNDIFTKWLSSTKMIGKNCEFIDTNSFHKYGVINNLTPEGGIEISTGGVNSIFHSGDVKIISF
jgi:BirA family biotin operon repressor/biotin-[acetyl-CoA-carboxylase] ligase